MKFNKSDFENYMKVFLQENSKLNLISKNDEKFLWEKHIFDSLAISKVFEKYGFPKKSFYDYQVSNGRGFVADFDGKYLKIREKI